STMVKEEDVPLFEFFARFELTNCCASIITNLLLVYLIIYRSSKEIGAYRYLLLAFVLNDINFPIVHFLTLPVATSYGDAFVMFSHGILTSRVSICLYACIFSQTMPLLAHLFVYRLIATKWPRHLIFYTGKHCFLMLTISVAFESSLWFLNCYFNYGPDQETTEYVQEFFDTEFSGEEPQFIGALYYSTEGEFRMRAFLATMGFNTIMSICMSVIVICSYLIFAHFRSSHVVWSGKTKKMQQHLFYTLVIQMIIPMIFVYLPCAGTINLPMLGFRLNIFPNAVSASLTFFPLIDAFIIMFG
ncbi:hypothetical protein PMAYCL1PPCAC_17254, partial [Pristionchus mayeri]